MRMNKRNATNCPLRVKLGSRPALPECPFYPQQQTSSARPGLSERCQTRKSAALFDHVVGAGEQCRWHNDAKRLCGLQIDHQFELGRLLDRQVGRLRTLENLVDEDGGPTKKISNIGPVGQKEARLGQLSLDRGGWQLIS